MIFEKEIDIIRRKKRELAMEYDVEESSIVYVGDNSFRIVKDGKEIKI